METFDNIAGRNPLPCVFRQALVRTYETRDEPLSPRLEPLLAQLPQADDGQRAFAPGADQVSSNQAVQS